jgi:hypothetical protein
MAEHFGQIAQLAFGAPPHQLAIVHGADPSRVITAIFHPPQTIDQIIDNVAPGENSNDTTHAAKRLSKLVGNAADECLSQDHRPSLAVNRDSFNFRAT